MSVYTRAAARAQAALTKRGRLATVNRYAPTRNTSTTAVTKGAATLTATPQLMEIPISYAPASLRGQLDTKLKNGSLARERCKFFMIEAVGQTFEPLPLDELTVGSDTWIAWGSTAIQPDGTPVLYFVGASL